MSFAPAISVADIGLRRGERWLIEGIDWTVAAGTCAAILGPNGCGKSTLARVITGYLWPTRGTVAVNGQLYGTVSLNEVRRQIRLVQAAGPYDVEPSLTARQVVLTGLFGTIDLFDPVGDEQVGRAEKWLARVGLAKLADRTYATLSSGERVRSLIARALIDRPALLLLDEPTNGLDLLAREQVLATVQHLFEHEDGPDAGPTTVVMITHHLEELAPATSNVLLMNEGRAIACGPPHEILTAERLSAVYQVPIRIRNVEGRRFVEVAPGAWQDLLDRS